MKKKGRVKKASYININTTCLFKLVYTLSWAFSNGLGFPRQNINRYHTSISTNPLTRNFFIETYDMKIVYIITQIILTIKHEIDK